MGQATGRWAGSFSSNRAKTPPSWVTSPPVSAPTGSPASLMALAGGRATPWPWRLKHSGSSAPEEVGFAVDSLLEETGFEPLVPPLADLGRAAVKDQQR